MKTTQKNKLQKVKNVYSFWGRYSRLYDAQDFFTFLGRAKYIRSTAVARLELKKGDKTLEVACGSGRNFTYLEKAIGTNGELVGFDYSHEMLDAANSLSQRNNWNNIKLIQGDAGRLDIPQKNFDGIISVLGISAVPDWENALRRSYELLKPGGRLVVCDARLFQGGLAFLNPLVKLIYSTFAAWDPSKNIPGKINDIFGNLEMENYNLGTFFIAVAKK